MLRTTRVFDLALRVFHWGLGAAFVTAWLTGGPRWLYWHIAAGWAVGVLLTFRLGWAFGGPDTARWRALLAPVSEVRAQIAALSRGESRPVLGHNPLGAWAAVGGLLGLGGLLLTGVVVQGGEEGHGPLAGLPLAVGLATHPVHEALAWALLAWACVHVIGVLKESWLRGANLAKAMVDGRQPGVRAEGDVRPFRGVAAVLVLALGVGGTLVIAGPARATPESPFLPFRSELPQDPAWNAACGECHLAFHPSLLPARSWDRLLDEQHDHFGEDLLLSEAEISGIRTFAHVHAAEAHESEHGARISASVPPGERPTEITSLGWWTTTHADVSEADLAAPGVDGAADCAACHRDAATGAFEDSAMHIPSQE